VTPVRPGATVLLGAALLAGCALPVSFESELIACRSGDDGTAANGVILMAQSVPSAEWVPCLDTVPLGWQVSDMEASDGAARFWLDSDRDGPRAIEVRFTASCDTDDATEIPSDRSGMRRLEEVTQLSPQYVGTRYYVFEGGCIAVLFTIAGQDRAEPLAVATQGIDALPRDELRTLVREESDGRLELDPPPDGGS
jgi:hypothetical protein